MRIGVFLTSTLLVVASTQAGFPDDSFLETSASGFGFDGKLNANLDRISEKLNNQRMQRLLSLDDNDGDIPGLKDLLKDDDVTRTAKQAVQSASPILDKASPRTRFIQMKEKKGQKTTTAATAATSLQELAKREYALEKQLKALETAIRGKDAMQQKKKKARLKKLKADIVHEVLAQIKKGGSGSVPKETEENDDENDDSSKDDTAPAQPSFRQRKRTPVHRERSSSLDSKKKVLLQLEHTLQALKKKKGRQVSKGGNHRFTEVGEPHYTDDWREKENSVSMEEQGDAEDDLDNEHDDY